MATATEKKPDLLRCLVVTPERTQVDQLVEFVALPLYDGELGVLPGHTPLIARLGHGELRTEAGTGVTRTFIDGGFAQVRDDVVTVLTQRAIPQEQIQAAAAQAELEKARAQAARSEEEIEARARAVDRARALVRMAGRR